MKFGMGSLYLKLLGEFHFCSH